MQLKTVKNMRTYSLPASELTLAKRIRRELSLFLYLQLILLLVWGPDFTLEVTLIVVYLLLLSLKPKRIVYHIDILEEEKSLELGYYFMVFFRRKLSLPFTELRTRTLHKRQGLGSATETLEFYRGKVIQGEIRLGGSWKWDETSFREIAANLEGLQQKD